VDVDDLYGLPLDQFVPQRTALARELRKAGDRERADEVAALKKPSVAAWAVNQLVRTQRKALGELLEAGDALRAAQDDVLAGRGDTRSLRAAVDGERMAVEALTAAARGLLSSGGDELSATIIERVADTLHAAALDDEGREQVREGRLERELRHVGLGVMSSPGATARAPGRTPSERAATKNKAESGATTKQAAEQERELRERAKAREEARREVRATEREARRRAERAERGAQVALERRDNAAVALDEAEARLEAAQDALAEAQAQVRDAEEAVREASG
jgi:hypothetical protein